MKNSLEIDKTTKKNIYEIQKKIKIQLNWLEREKKIKTKKT